MSLFTKWEKDYVYAIGNGKTLSLSKVSDPVFSSEMMGKGIAFKIDDDIIYSPCVGKIVMIAPTKHALGIRMENGAEILIHIGLNTVELNGKGFEVLVDINQNVKPYSKLVKINRKIMNENNVDLTTMVINTNSNIFSFEMNNYSTVKAQDRLFKIGKQDESY